MKGLDKGKEKAGVPVPFRRPERVIYTSPGQRPGLAHLPNHGALKGRDIILRTTEISFIVFNPIALKKVQ